MLGQTLSSDRSRLVRLRRAELFAGLFILGCANGLVTPVGQSINQVGWMNAIYGTFNISLIVWSACFAGVLLILRGEIDDVRSADVTVGAVFLLFVFLPMGQLSWLAVTGLCLYILFSTDADQSARRGVMILLATTVPMLWSKLLFHVFFKFILEIDAALVSWELGTHRTGNMVEFADHSATLVIRPACSSLANMSLAFLCWVAMGQLVRHRWRPIDLLWCLVACASVVTVNVARMGLMGLSLSHYNAIHSPTGDMITGWIILILTVGISVFGLKHEIFSRA
jgi:exosortase/archaeosortase family protein